MGKSKVSAQSRLGSSSQQNMKTIGQSRACAFQGKQGKSDLALFMLLCDNMAQLKSNSSLDSEYNSEIFGGILWDYYVFWEKHKSQGKDIIYAICLIDSIFVPWENDTWCKPFSFNEILPQK